MSCQLVWFLIGFATAVVVLGLVAFVGACVLGMTGGRIGK